MPELYILIPGMFVGFAIAHWRRFAWKPEDRVLTFLGFVMGATLAWGTVDPWMLLTLVLIIPMIVRRRRSHPSA